MPHVTSNPKQPMEDIVCCPLSMFQVQPNTAGAQKHESEKGKDAHEERNGFTGSEGRVERDGSGGTVKKVRLRDSMQPTRRLGAS